MIQRKEIFALLTFLSLITAVAAQPMHGLLRVKARSYGSLTYEYTYPGIDSIAPAEELNFEHPTDLWGLRLWGEDEYQDIHQGDYFCAPIAYVDTAYLTIRNKGQYEPMLIELIATPGLTDHNLIFDFRPGNFRFELDRLKKQMMGERPPGFLPFFDVERNLSDEPHNHWMVLDNILQFEYLQLPDANGFYLKQDELEEHRPRWFRKMAEPRIGEPDCAWGIVLQDSPFCHEILYAQPLFLLNSPQWTDKGYDETWKGMMSSDSINSINEVMWQLMSSEFVKCNKTYAKYRIWNVHLNSDSLLGLELLEYAGVPAGGMRDSVLNYRQAMEEWCAWEAEKTRRSQLPKWKQIPPVKWFRSSNRQPPVPSLNIYQDLENFKVCTKIDEPYWQQVSRRYVVDWMLMNLVTAGGKSPAAWMHVLEEKYDSIPGDRRFVFTYDLRTNTFPTLEELFGPDIRRKIFEYLKVQDLRSENFTINLNHFDPANNRHYQWAVSQYGLIIAIGNEGEFWQDEIVYIPYDWIALPREME